MAFSMFMIIFLKSNRMEYDSAISFETQLDEQHLFSQSYFKNRLINLICNTPMVCVISSDQTWRSTTESAYFCAGTDALSLCSPTGINGWTYTQKQTTLAVEGFY